NSQNFLAGPGAASAPPGYVERSYSEETAHEIDAVVKKIVDDAFRRTVNLLRGQRATLERGARQLLQHETLDERKLAALLPDADPNAPKNRQRDLMHEPESLELIRLYYAISDQDVRRQFLDMVKTVAKPSPPPE